MHLTLTTPQPLYLRTILAPRILRTPQQLIEVYIKLLLVIRTLRYSATQALIDNPFPCSTQSVYARLPAVEHSSCLREPAMPQAPARPFTPPESSPDPLTLRSGGAVRTRSPTAVTPQKRKLVVEIQTPSIKRLQSMKSLSSSSLGEKSSTVTKTPQSTQSSVPVTPSSSATSFSNMSQASANSTPTAKRIVNLAYVSLPARPYLTPKSNRKLDSDDLGAQQRRRSMTLSRALLIL